MRIAITGASGKLGGATRAYLIDKGLQVRTIGRQPSEGDFALADLSNVESCVSALEGVDLLVHAAGKVADRFDENLDMALAIGTACSRMGIPVINFSSLSVYGRVRSQLADEGTPCNPVTKYGISKLQAENVLNGTGSEVCHIRIGNVIAETEVDGELKLLKRVLKAGETTNAVFQRDVADICYFLATLDNRPPVLNLARPGQDFSTHADLHRLRTHRKRKRLLSTPPLVPHALRLARGVASINATTRYVSSELPRLNYRFLSHQEAAPSTWNLPENPSSAKQLRVLYGVDDTDARRGGGTATRTNDVAENLATLGLGSTIVSLSKDSTASGEPLSSGGVLRLELPSLSQRFYLPSPAVRKVSAEVAKADVLHLMGHWSPLNLYLAFLARRLQKPYVVCGAGSFKVWGRSRYLKRLFNLAGGYRFVREASGWIAVVQEELSDFDPYGIPRSQVKIIPNGVDTARKVDGPQPQRRRPYLLFLGRLAPIKGPDLLLEAFIRSAKDLPFDVIFAGPDGGLLPSLTQQTEAAGLQDRVHFPGFVSGDEKASLLGSATALVLPSRSEAMSIVALEAAGYGRPVVATDQCGIDELVGDDRGVLVEASVESISDGLLRLATMETDRMGEAFRDEVARSFGWDAIAAMYQSLFEEICY